ncbi:hypothetical protein EV182_003479 [Spiromyces aspiralis]|uniref:Uncharacterized protein n=1 Tax=Spiromyces aspiralis TaxID=68401 RepID=A0ACC1HRR8_9FUNG|nr:hypothetical protein EV182_003479 [Spiromyces aspiralis]
MRYLPINSFHDGEMMPLCHYFAQEHIDHVVHKVDNITFPYFLDENNVKTACFFECRSLGTEVLKVDRTICSHQRVWIELFPTLLISKGFGDRETTEHLLRIPEYVRNHELYAKIRELFEIEVRDCNSLCDYIREVSGQYPPALWINEGISIEGLAHSVPVDGFRIGTKHILIDSFIYDIEAKADVGIAMYEDGFTLFSATGWSQVIAECIAVLGLEWPNPTSRRQITHDA